MLVDPETPYMSIMLKAMKSWTQDSLYAPYFHQTGYLRVDTGDFSDRAVQTYKELGVENGAEWLSVDEVRSRFPQFSTATSTVRVEYFGCHMLDGQMLSGP